MKKINSDFATLTLCALLAVLPELVFATEIPIHTSPCSTSSCGLELVSENGTTEFAPLMGTNVEINVSGSAVHTAVIQSFTNPTNEWVEGIYSYPLPSGAAVNQLEMQIGNRIIVGEIKEKIAAEKTYLKAKASGKKASLVTSHRPNIFTTKLANLGPNESIKIRIEYFKELPLNMAAQQLRFPMVIGPRYTPTSVTAPQAPGGIGVTSYLDADARARAPAPSQMGLLTTADSSHHPHVLRINLNLGVALHAIRSLYHPVDIQQEGETEYRVTLSEGSVTPNRDFVLEFSPAPQDKPKTALLAEISNGYHYGLFMLMPPTLSKSHNLPREITFILDRSGSMGGTSIVQAKAALIRTLEQLSSKDRFNIIWFNGSHNTLFPAIVDATPGNLAHARATVSRIQASGGTEMLGALEAAFNTDGSSNHVQQTIFITDGNVSNEAGLFTFIEDNLDERRLFTVGIGSAPNQYFLQHAAIVGRGAHTFIGNTNEVQDKMGVLFKKLSHPMLRDLKVDSESDDIEFWPRTLPDLYADEPIAISFRTKSPNANLRLRGKLPDSHWQADATLHGGQQRRGIAELWAKRKITYLMDDYRHSRNNPEAQAEIRQLVLNTALSHHLVSKFTSLVAVDKTPSNIALSDNKTGRVAQHKPHGWSLGSTARLPQTGTDNKLRITLGLLILAIFGVGYIRRRPVHSLVLRESHE